MAFAHARLEQLLKGFAKTIDPIIKEALDSSVNRRYHKLLEYQISTGGKRLRPALAMLVCRMVGGKEKNVLYPAAALEILHNYTLIVDDIIDHSTKRRGQPTVWAKYGVSVAQCLAMDYAASIGDGAQQSPHCKKILSLLSETLKTITEGQILDILFENSCREHDPFIKKHRPKRVQTRDYLHMIEKKSAALFEASCQIGGLCANATPKQLKALKKFGHHLGVTFQISDDLLDIFGNESKFGKKIGKDIEEKKRGNILIMHALASLKGKDKKQFQKILIKSIPSLADLKKGVQLIKETNATQKANVLLQSSLKSAKNALRGFPQNQWKQRLSELADYIAQREV